MAFNVCGDLVLERAGEGIFISGGNQGTEFAELFTACGRGAEDEADFALGGDIGVKVSYAEVLAVAFGGQSGLGDKGAAEPAHDQLHNSGQ